MLQMVAHATVSGYGEPIADWHRAVDKALADKRVAGAAPYVEAQTLLSGPRKQPRSCAASCRRRSAMSR